MRDLVRHPVRSRRASLAISVAAVVALSFVACAIPAAASPPGWSHAGGVRVFRVGTWHGIRGQYSSIQSTVNAHVRVTGSSLRPATSTSRAAPKRAS